MEQCRDITVSLEIDKESIKIDTWVDNNWVKDFFTQLVLRQSIFRFSTFTYAIFKNHSKSAVVQCYDGDATSPCSSFFLNFENTHTYKHIYIYTSLTNLKL